MTTDGGGLAGGWSAGAYVRRARVAPVALVVAPLLPVAGTAAATLPGWLKLTASTWLLVAYLVQELGRDRGLQIQDELWTSWGGPPTTDALRWRTSTNPVITRNRHRDVIAAIGGGLILPSSTDEQRSPNAADQQYEAAIAQLRDLTRGTNKFLTKENAGYGFRRNCLGLRTWGIGAAILALATTLVLAQYAAEFRSLIGVSVAVSVLSALFWILIVNRNWVRRQALSYSNALFAVAAQRARDTTQATGTDQPDEQED